MNDTAPPSMPSSTSRAGDSAAPLARGEQALKIIGTTDELQSLRKPVRLDGVVVRISKDGTSATIETDKGNVEVQLKARTVLEVGQKVQVDISAGQPPRQIVIRPAPEQPAPQIPADTRPPAPQPSNAPPAVEQRPGTTQPAPSQADAPLPVTSPPQSGGTPSRITPQPPLPTGVREILDMMAPLPPGPIPRQPAPLPTDAIIRLVPLTTLPPDAQLLPQTETMLSRIPDLIRQGATIQLPAGASEFPDLNVQAPTVPHELPSAMQPLQTTLISAPDSGLDSGTLQTKMNDAPGLQFQSIRLPLQKQIFPFIIPVTDHAVTPPAGMFDMRVIAITPNGIAPATPDHAELTRGASPLTIKGDVIATTAQHFPVLSMIWPGNETPDAFLLQFPASNMPVGTQIELQPQIMLHPTLPVAGLPGLPTPAIDLMQGWDWPVFDDALQVLSPQMPVAQAMGNMIPNAATPAHIPPAMLFFMAAVGAGDLSGWIGEKAVNALRREGIKGAEILSRMTRDFAGLSRMSDDPVIQDWKATAIPMMWHNEISKIHLFYRHQDAEKDDEQEISGERTTRFLFDFNLTRIGDVQLDGYMKGKRLDLIVRTKTFFSSAMQNNMRRIYQNVLDQGGLGGDLGFQNRADQWVHVDMRQAALKTSV